MKETTLYVGNYSFLIHYFHFISKKMKKKVQLFALNLTLYSVCTEKVIMHVIVVACLYRYRYANISSLYAEIKQHIQKC